MLTGFPVDPKPPVLGSSARRRVRRTIYPQATIVFNLWIISRIKVFNMRLLQETILPVPVTPTAELTDSGETLSDSADDPPSEEAGEATKEPVVPNFSLRPKGRNQFVKFVEGISKRIFIYSVITVVTEKLYARLFASAKLPSLIRLFADGDAAIGLHRLILFIATVYTTSLCFVPVISTIDMWLLFWSWDSSDPDFTSWIKRKGAETGVQTPILAEAVRIAAGVERTESLMREIKYRVEIKCRELKLSEVDTTDQICRCMTLFADLSPADDRLVRGWTASFASSRASSLAGMLQSIRK